MYAPKVWNSLSRLKSRDSREGRVASMNCFKKTFKELNELNQSEDEQEKEAAKTIDKIIDEFLLFVKDKNDFLFKKLKRLKYGRLGR